MRFSINFHIKTLLIVNIILTSAILMSRDLVSSTCIFLAGICAFILFFGAAKLKKYFSLLYKFRVLFLTLFIFQLLLRRQGEVYFELYFLKITETGVYYAFSSILRYFIILLSATMLASASPYEMVKALRTWRLPEALTIIVSFTILFLRQLQTDFVILQQNLQKRNIDFRRMRWKRRFEIGSGLIVPVIGRIFSEIKYKVISMELNGYGYHNSPPLPPPACFAARGGHFPGYFYKKCKASDYMIMFGFLTITIVIFLLR